MYVEMEIIEYLKVDSDSNFCGRVLNWQKINEIF